MSKIKNMLEKLRPNQIDNKQAKTVERIAAIGHSSDAVGWRPVPYITPDRFEQFLGNLDADIESFIAQANPDCYNAHFYEKTVDGEVTLALKELAAQRTEHKRSIHNIRIYQQASLIDIENHRKRMEEAFTNKKEVK